MTVHARRREERGGAQEGEGDRKGREGRDVWYGPPRDGDLRPQAEDAHGEPIHAHHDGGYVGSSGAPSLLQPAAPSVRRPVPEDVETDAASGQGHNRLAVLSEC